MLHSCCRVADDLHPLRVLALFRNIVDEDLDVLDIAGEAARR
jgi:DNA-directed RNA polymerase III subunit RPC1